MDILNYVLQRVGVKRMRNIKSKKPNIDKKALKNAQITTLQQASTPKQEWTDEDHTRGLILVGNGSSIMHNELGEKIDQFKEIVRFNDFDILKGQIV